MAGIQFFKMSYADINYLITDITVSSNSEDKEFLVNRDPYYVWESTGSNDSTTETVTLDFGVSRRIDTLFLINHNLKAFQFQYDNGGVWTTLLTVADNAEAVYFGQFSAVNTRRVRLLMDTTQTVDAEKSIQNLHVTEAIGQLVGYPAIRTDWDKNDTTKKMLNGANKVVINSYSREFTLAFKDHVGAEDRTLFRTLVQLNEAFLIWPCGGNVDQFAFQDLGYRLEDLFLVCLEKGFAHDFSQNLYFSGFNSSVKLIESA